MLRLFASRPALRPHCRAILPAILLAASASTAMGQTVTVQNDCLVAGGFVNVCPCFAANEEAAVWLTAPCTGVITQVQILWRSQLQNQPQSLENFVAIYNGQGATFPNPGPIMTNNFGATQALMEGPVLTDGFMNAFQWLDEQQTIPLSVSVTAGQKFVVSLSFANSNENQTSKPSVASDVHANTVQCPHPQCQAGKNAVKANGLGWVSSCLLGVTGDWVIRAVIECGQTTGACCINGNCTNGLTQTQCTSLNGVFQGANTNCSRITCPPPTGACCVASTQQCADVSEATCAAFNGVFQGAGTSCSTFVCFPMGACCLESGACNAGPMSPAACQALGGTFAGHNTTCATANCTAPLGACCAGSVCAGVVTQAACNALGGTWAYPVTSCATPFACPYCPEDIAHNGAVDVNDLLGVISAWGPCNNCPGDIAPVPFGNNVVDVNDLLAVITNWGTCP